MTEEQQFRVWSAQRWRRLWAFAFPGRPAGFSRRLAQRLCIALLRVDHVVWRSLR